jgi:hypothetical protein
MTTTFTPADFSKARILADKLMASGLPAEYSDEVDELSRAECAALDSIAFECQVCNHWFPQSQNATKDSARWLCTDCAKDE